MSLFPRVNLHDRVVDRYHLTIG